MEQSDVPRVVSMDRIPPPPTLRGSLRLAVSIIKSSQDLHLGKNESDITLDPTHYGTKPGHFETSKIHFPTSEGVSEVSERASE